MQENNNVFKLKTVSIAGIGTFGTLMTPTGDELCKTVEREWKNNKPSVSCFPEGFYELIWRESPKYGKRLHVQARSLGVTVEGPSQRTHCMFHAANFPNQLQGCVAPGQSFLGDKWGVANSRLALGEFENEVHGVMLANDGRAYLKVDRNHV